MTQAITTAPAADSGQPPGLKISRRYDIVKTLAGGMGLVFLAIDRQDNRPVALKTFKPDYLSNRKARDRFLQEAQTWVDLGNHPHIVPAYRVESGRGPEPFLVLAWISPAEGKESASLSAWLTPGQLLPPAQAFTFALHICRGMKHAAAVIPGLVHRDLKPSNILVGHDGLAKISDFGLAGSWIAPEAAESPLLITGRVGAGSPPYMPPEQWESPGPFTASTDIYAFGCILFEFFTGKVAVFNQPRDEMTVLRQQIGPDALNQQLYQAHLAGLLKHIPADLPPALVNILRNCLARQPEHRYPDWPTVETSLVAAYRQVLGQEPPPEPGPAAATQAEQIAAGWSYHSIGASYCDLGNYREATPYFEQALQIGRAAAALDLECAALGSLGLTATRLGQIEQGQQHLTAALTLARRLNDPHRESQTLISLGTVSPPQQAAALFERALTIARQNQNPQLELDALGNLGNLAAAAGRPQQAIQYFEQHLSLARNLDDRLSQAQTLTNIGALYLDVGQPQQAIELLKPALAFARQIAHQPAEGKVIVNAAAAYYQLGDTPRALNLYEKSLNIAREIGEPAMEGQSLAGMGTACARLGLTEQAITYLEQALRLQAGAPLEVATTSLNLATLLLSLNRPVEARTYAEQAAHIFNNFQHTPMVKRCQELLNAILHCTG